VIAGLGEARRKYQRRADLTPRAGFHRLAHRRGWQREDGEVDALRQIIGAFEHLPAVDRLIGPADQMDVTRKAVDLQSLQDDLAGAARPH